MVRDARERNMLIKTDSSFIYQTHAQGYDPGSGSRIGPEVLHRTVYKPIFTKWVNIVDV